MGRVLLVHWNEAEAIERAAPLRRAGHDVALHWSQDSTGLRGVRGDPPDCVVIDLARLPSQGRAVGTWLRQTKATRHVPLVFVEGDADKSARVRAALPDATYTPRRTLRGAVTRALRARSRAPVVVPGTMEGYSGTPLAAKLGIRSGRSVALLGAPRGFEATLGTLPEGASLRRGASRAADVVLLFARTRAALAKGFAPATRVVTEGGRLWIVWPKRTSSLAGDLTQADVRAFGLARGWVDFKICAVDSDWSGLCFSRRVGRRPARKA
jgi:CheY-like chemotaxis protein